MTGRRRGARFKISTLERESGFTRDAIHHYVRLGLLRKPEKASATVAWYDQHHLDRLRSIRALRAHGLALPLIGRLLDAGGDHASIDDLEGIGRLLSAGAARDSAPALVPDASAFAFASQLGIAGDAVLSDAKLGAALAALMAVPEAARDLCLESASAVYASTRALAETRRRLMGAWLARARDGAAAMAAVRSVNDAVGDFAVAIREHFVRCETERGMQEILTAADRATRARWLPAGSAAAAGGVAMLEDLDGRASRGDTEALRERVRLLYGLGPARRLAEATQAARDAGIDDAWIALAAGVARLDAGDLAGARSDFAASLERRAGWALARVYLSATILLGVARGESGLMQDALEAVTELEAALPMADEAVMDRLWTLLVKGQTLLGLPEVLGRAELARTLCEEVVGTVAELPRDHHTRHSGEAARIEGNAWLTLAAARRATGDIMGERVALVRATEMAGPVAHAARARLRVSEEG